MSITRSTSSPQPDEGPYTVIGGDYLDREAKGRPGLSILVISRGPKPLREDLLNELSKIPAREIISIGPVPPPVDAEELARRFEKLRFIVFSRESSTGARINAAFREALSEHVLVVGGDMAVSASSVSAPLVNQLVGQDRLCTVPVFRDRAGELLPTAAGPLPGHRGAFEIQPTVPGSGRTPTLLPWDYCGVYRVDRHAGMGGFDTRIREAWWQKIEYGVRAWMWGEELFVHPDLRFSYRDAPAPEDSSAAAGYFRFFFKTLAIRHRRDAGRLPLRRRWSYIRGAGVPPGTAALQWRELRHWVRANRYRFRKDARSLTELWQWGES